MKRMSLERSVRESAAIWLKQWGHVAHLPTESWCEAAWELDGRPGDGWWSYTILVRAEVARVRAKTSLSQDGTP